MLNKLKPVLEEKLEFLKTEGRLKGEEKIINRIESPQDGWGRKIVVQDGAVLLNFASNSYLGISSDPRLVNAEHEASSKFGVGPGAVRFISGTQRPHVELEQKLRELFSREACMIFSSAYAANCGIVAPLVDADTVIISDELNHNSIIMAIRLSGIPKERKKIYSHCNMDELKTCIADSEGKAKKLIIVTDGVFSMRGNYAPLDRIADLAERFSPKFEQGIITIVDDSHGIGAFGKTGRGTIEVCNTPRIDLITGTLGKALGVDGGFVISDRNIIEYLREVSPFYVYSNPVSSGVASAALKAVEILDSDEGKELLSKLKQNTEYFRNGIYKIGFKTIEGIHPIVPIVIGDAMKAKAIASELYQRGVFVIALTFPVVPRGQDTIRVQIAASHTRQDLDYALQSFEESGRKVGVVG